MQLGIVDHKDILQAFLPQLGVSCFLYIGNVTSRNVPTRTSTKEKQDVCPGYDGNGDAPIGCLGINKDIITMGAIHQ
jgi:hypothetical protein